MDNPFEDIIERLNRIERLLISQGDKPKIPELPQLDECGIKEASTITGYRPSTIYRLSSEGGIPCQKRGRTLLFSRKQLQQWTNDRTITKDDPGAIAAAHLAETVQKRQARKR